MSGLDDAWTRNYADGYSHGLSALDRDVPVAAMRHAEEKLTEPWRLRTRDERGYWIGYVRGWRHALHAWATDDARA